MSNNSSNLFNLNALVDNSSLAPLGCSCPACQSLKNRLDTSSSHVNTDNNISNNDELLLNNNFNQVGNQDSKSIFSTSPQNPWANLLANATTQTTTSSSTGVTAAATISGSGDSQIDGILSGYKWGFSWGTKQLTYSFYEDTVFNGSYYGTETGVREVSEGVKANVRSILNWLENVINIDFVEVTETSNNYGRMRFMLSNDPSYAYAYYPSSDSMASVSGDVHLNPNYDRLGDTNGFQNSAGQHGYMSLVHEIGHALGLKHSFEAPAILAQEDNTTNTVMTYNFTGNSAGTYMGFDVKALQYMYGAKAYNATDTAYQFTTRVDQFSVAGQLFLNTPNLTKQLIWDSGGQDTLDFSNLSANGTGYRFDLNPGGILTTKAAYNGTSYSVNGVTYQTTTYGTEIGYNVVIENLINSGSSDEIFANSAANRFTGYSPTRSTGNDTYWNTTSADILDLSSYSSSSITRTASGSDLILGLGSNGTITVKNYYLNNPISLLFSDSIVASINDVTVTEGNNAILTVNLSSASTQTISLNYATANISAIAGQDYNTSSGILTFNPGETSKTISIGTIDDTVSEPNTETFAVNLSNSVNAIIGDNQGIVSIAPSDGQPVISINSVTSTEGTSKTVKSTKNFGFTVSLSNTSSQAISVQYATANGTATAGSDYITNSGTLTFNPGVTSQTVSVAVYQDSTVEQNENFIINLSNPTNATLGVSQGIGTITNDDSGSATKALSQPASTSSSSTTSVIPDNPLITQFQGLFAASVHI